MVPIRYGVLKPRLSACRVAFSMCSTWNTSPTANRLPESRSTHVLEEGDPSKSVFQCSECTTFLSELTYFPSPPRQGTEVRTLHRIRVEG
jgi:hypothetical protein